MGVKSFDDLVEIVEEVKNDMEKAEKGNKAAGVRVRGAMQQIKKAAQQVRGDILAIRQ